MGCSHGDNWFSPSSELEAICLPFHGGITNHRRQRSRYPQHRHHGRVLDIGTGCGLQNRNNVGSIPTSPSIGRQLSWLESSDDTRKVGGSNPPLPTSLFLGRSYRRSVHGSEKPAVMVRSHSDPPSYLTYHAVGHRTRCRCWRSPVAASALAE